MISVSKTTWQVFFTWLNKSEAGIKQTIRGNQQKHITCHEVLASIKRVKAADKKKGKKIRLE